MTVLYRLAHWCVNCGICDQKRLFCWWCLVMKGSSCCTHSLINGWTFMFPPNRISAHFPIPYFSGFDSHETTQKIWLPLLSVWLEPLSGSVDQLDNQQNLQYAIMGFFWKFGSCIIFEVCIISLASCLNVNRGFIGVSLSSVLNISTHALPSHSSKSFSSA